MGNLSTLVSILMTAYNREKFISEAIESVLAQTYTNWELIIVDDCSKDNTVNISKKYAKKDERISVYINEKNLGDYPNRNKAASYAKGDLIMYLDSDDSISSDALDYFVNAFVSYPEAMHSTIYYHELTAPELMSSYDAIYNHFYVNNMLATGPGARVFKRSFFESLGGFPVKYGPANDMYFNLYSASLSQILLLPYSYLNYRIHAEQESKNMYSYLTNGYNYFQDFISSSLLPLTAEQINNLKNKSKKRFIINSVRYLFKTRHLTLTIDAYKKVGFKWRDFFIALCS